MSEQQPTHWDGEHWRPAPPPQDPGQEVVPVQPIGYQTPVPYGYGGYQQGYPPPGYGMPGYGPGYVPVVAPKSPGLSLLVSFFIPGVGSMMNGDAGIGIVILLGYLLSIPFWLFCFIGAPFTVGFFVWGLVDAYQGAVRWNRRHGIIA